MSDKSTTPSPIEERIAKKDTPSNEKSDPTDFENDPFIENPVLRFTAYAARAGRLIGTALAKGVRYTAYTSDVGEAFRPVVDARWVRAGYAISWTYVLGDVAYNTKVAIDNKQDYKRAALHAATFQTFGSMLFPAMIIHTVVHQSEKVFHKAGIHNRWASVGLGLCTIPFLPFICDHPVEYAVDRVFDEFWPLKDGAKSHGHAKHE
jgi:fission process protein 1